MRILFLCYRGNPYCGGQGIYLYYLARELAKLGAEIDIVVGPPYPFDMEWAKIYRLENLNLYFTKTRSLPFEKLTRIFSFWNFADYFLTRFHIFPEMETFSLRAFFFLKKLLREKKYDIIHDVQCLGWGLLPMKGYGIPIVTTVHHPLHRDREADFSTNRTLWEYLTTVLFYPLIMQRIVINRLDRVITSSLNGVGELKTAFGLDPSVISVVYNGMDAAEFRNTGEEREENALLFVGNAEDRKKGIAYLLEALKMLPEEVSLTIVDDGPPVKLTAYDLVKKMNLEKRVCFTGKISNRELVRLYSTKTILVMPSLHEGFGLPAAEAMSCGMAVVATAAGALKEVVGGGAGILVPPKDPAALRDAVIKLLKDKELCLRMGYAGAKRAAENFDWPVAARRTLDVYREVIREYGRNR